MEGWVGHHSPEGKKNPVITSKVRNNTKINLSHVFHHSERVSKRQWQEGRRLLALEAVQHREKHRRGDIQPLGLCNQGGHE